MHVSQVMEQLEKFGTEQTRKTYARHGVDNSKMFGVKFGDLTKVSKQIKKELDKPACHDLALELRATENVDARSLASYLVQPNLLTPEIMEQWVASLSFYFCGMVVANPFAESPHALALSLKRMKDDGEYIRSAGYDVFSRLLKDAPPEAVELCPEVLVRIEKEIHDSKNRARYSMNNCLIAIGGWTKYTDQAIATAKRIGKVEVDHGDTSCKTPDAVSYIQKVLDREKKKRTTKK